MPRLDYPFDPGEFMDSRRGTKRKLLADGTKRIRKKIAVLGGSTTSHLVGALEVFLLNYGILPEFYESEYDRYWQDAMFDNPGLRDFCPDIIYIHTSWHNIKSQTPSPAMSNEEANQMLKDGYNHFESMWKKLKEDYSVPIIQNNFELPPYRIFGNRDSFDRRGAVNFVTRLNLMFADYAEGQEGFYINDINYVSADYGLEAWHDESAWYMFKQACTTTAIPALAFNLANIIKSLLGKNKKVLALDLDNTLWGGVVGDDGVEGIEIGEETATAECFKAFGEYVKKHKEIGVMLTVASKNDHDNAIAGLNHPDGVLRPEDFVVIKANWETKDRNLAMTAAEMDLGVDSFVFADDNPTERELVRRSIEGIAVPEFTDPVKYIKTLDRNGYFEVTSFSPEDIKRNEMYKANVKRAELSHDFVDYGEYLHSLKMTAEIKGFAPIYLQRITQLINRSNQFNLTTRRYTQPEIEHIAEDDNYITLYGKLTDIFGDNGVVAVVIGKVTDEVCHIDLWLMSCRVLKKDMEYAMLDTLVAECKAKGVKTIRGYYYPTSKNNMVKDLYSDFGFGLTEEDAEGNRVFELNIEGYMGKNKYIQTNPEEQQ